MKKIFWIIVSVAIVSLLLIGTAAADTATSGKCGNDLYWNFDETSGTLHITGSGEMWDYGVNTIPWEGLSDGIKCIWMDQLTSEGATTIGNYAFYDLHNLTEVRIDTGIVSIGECAFAYCYALTSIDIPQSVTHIGDASFFACWALTSIIIPDSVETIGESAFSECFSLTEAAIPASVTSIGEGVFDFCTNLQEIIVSPNNEAYKTVDGVLYSENSELLLAYPARKEGTEYQIPDGVKRICKKAFSYCSSLSTVTIPDGVVSIGLNAFYQCSGLTSITIPDSVTSIETQAFFWCGNLTEITVPDSVTSVDDSAFEGTGWWNAQNDGLVYLDGILLGYKGECPQTVAVEAGTRLIAAYALYGCEDLAELTVPDSVTRICDYAFCECTALETVTFGNRLEEIGEAAFYECESLSEITLPDSLKSIDEGAFDGCTGLTSFFIPDSVTSIGNSAFGGCTGLTSITIPDSVTSIGNSAFGGCTGLTSITIPDSVTELGGGAFWMCSGLTSVSIGNGVTVIRSHTFRECTGLTELTLPDSVTTVEPWALMDCTGLTSITMPCSVVFEGSIFCKNITTIRLTKGTGRMPDFDDVHDWFRPYYELGQRSLTVVLDEGITHIGAYAFRECYGLKEITLPNSVESIGAYAFCEASNLKSITIPKGLTYVGVHAFNGSGLQDVYYGGTRTERFANLTVDDENWELLDARWHYVPEAIEGTVEWNGEDVRYKGTTAYVIANGEEQTPRFSVKNKADGSVIEPEFYDYAYKENTAAGTGYVFVTFKDVYEGSCRGVFKIYLPPTQYTTVENVKDGVRLTWAPVDDAAGYVIYRRAWSSTTDGWTDFVRWNNTTALEWVDTKVYAGTRYQYGIKAYFAKRTDAVTGAQIGGNVGDNYNLGEVGPLKTTVRITTRTLSSVTPGTKQMTVKWGASAVFTGYQIQYATDSDFTQNLKTVKVTNPKTTQKVIKSLTAGTTYYVRVRSYHVFNGMTYFGEWSNVKSCRVK